MTEYKLNKVRGRLWRQRRRSACFLRESHQSHPRHESNAHRLTQTHSPPFLSPPPTTQNAQHTAHGAPAGGGKGQGGVCCGERWGLPLVGGARLSTDSQQQYHCSTTAVPLQQPGHTQTPHNDLTQPTQYANSCKGARRRSLALSCRWGSASTWRARQ